MNVRLAILLVCFFSSSTFAGDVTGEYAWSDLEGGSVASDAVSGSRLLSLDTRKLISQMDTPASVSSSGAAKSVSVTYIELPLPSGKTIKLQASEYSVMEKGAKAFGDFRSWKVTGVDEPATSGVIDISSNGFHAMLFLANGETVFIEPTDLLANLPVDLKGELLQSQFKSTRVSSQKNTYKSFTRSSISSELNAPFTCGVHAALPGGLVDSLTGGESKAQQSANKAAPIAYRRARNIRNYRLAMAATGEFTQFFLRRGLDPNLAINTIVSRVNAIYNRDLAINLELIADNSFLVFIDPDNDPYAVNSDSALLERNTSVIDSIIGSGAYDVGHVLTRFSNNITGGVAILASVCVDDRGLNAKGAGTTGANNPNDPAFAIDFVAHEIGHQLGGSHTFNSATGSCAGTNRQPETAFEPGGGSSVMAYAGICGINNIAAHSLSVFHIESIDQINQNVLEGRGNRCGTDTPTFNEAPDITAITSGLTIDAGDEFTLTGTATDVDGDALTFAWNQVDSGRVSNKFVDLGDNALFAVQAPTESARRDFEGLALTNRNLTFKLVVRDGRGGVSSAETTVNVINGVAPPPPNSLAGSGGGSGGKIDFLLFLLFVTVMIVSNRGLIRISRVSKIKSTGEKNV